MVANLYGNDMFGASAAPKAESIVAQRFGFTPFSVLDSRRGEWQERKRAWMATGIKSEIGRSDSLLSKGEKIPQSDFSPSGIIPPCEYAGGNAFSGAGTSIFDPCLAEAAYRWFCPVGGQVVDPFAGGSVRGIVAGALGLPYWGCDLRSEQVAANVHQADEISTVVRPAWVCGDSLDQVSSAPDADFIFSCPPYGDLEVYSDDPADLSNMEWHTFIAAYRRIIQRSLERLKDDRFACFVVGDFRDKTGFYRSFIGETIRAFDECGAGFYNEAIYISPAGSGLLRVTKQFTAGRKLVKIHQNMLVFCKGNWRKAAAACRSDAASEDA
jgi:hypothetical protein